MNLFTDNNEDDDAKFTISDEKGNTIEQQKTMRVLGYEVNNKNNLEAHMSSLMSRMSYSHFKLREALPYMTSKNKKIILDAKIRSQLNLTLPLVINQSMRIQKRACTMLMKINKWTYNGPTFKVKSEVICKKLGV